MRPLIPLIVLFAPWLCFAVPQAKKSAKSSTKSTAAKAPSASAGVAEKAGGGAGTAGNGNGNAGNMNTPSDAQIANAVLSWMNDTGKVTNFINTATSFSGDEFTQQATIALNAELDELNHKNVLDDALLSQNAMVQAANEVLAVQGTFQAVVDVLQVMVNEGPDNAQAQVDAINKNRCVNVLPNIDMYFAAAGMASVSAVRPTGCLEIQAATATSSASDGAQSAAATATSTAEATAAASAEASSSSVASESAATTAAAKGKAGKAKAAKAKAGKAKATKRSTAAADLKS